MKKPKVRIFTATNSSGNRPSKKYSLGPESASRPPPGSVPTSKQGSAHSASATCPPNVKHTEKGCAGNISTAEAVTFTLPHGVEWPNDPRARRVVEVIFKDMSNSRRAPQDDRQKAYRAACLSWHPDKNPKHEKLATEVFQFLQSLKNWYFEI